MRALHRSKGRGVGSACACVWVAGVLAGCGEGGNPGEPLPSPAVETGRPQGLQSGPLTSGSGDRPAPLAIEDGDRWGVDGDPTAEIIVGDGFLRSRRVAAGGRLGGAHLKGIGWGSTASASLTGNHDIGAAAMAGARAIGQVAPLFSLVRSADVENHVDRQVDIASVVGDWTVRSHQRPAEPSAAPVGRFRAGTDGVACGVAGPARLPSSGKSVSEGAPSSGARLCEQAGLAMARSAFVSVVSDSTMQPALPLSDPERALGLPMTAAR